MYLYFHPPHWMDELEFCGWFSFHLLDISRFEPIHIVCTIGSGFGQPIGWMILTTSGKFNYFDRGDILVRAPQPLDGFESNG